MNKNKWLKIINLLLGIDLLVVALTGILQNPLHDLEILKMIHRPSSNLFVLLSIVHIILNWSWIKANVRKNSKNNSKNKHMQKKVA